VLSCRHKPQELCIVSPRQAIVGRQLEPIERRMTSIEHELRDVNRRLDILEERFSNIKGVTSEIDELRDRLREIEKHLGLNRRIAA
jgi:chromosome segregation ATPase